ncbi:hypothetical protein V8E51_020024 [Hyaloscypha variabilis]
MEKEWMRRKRNEVIKNHVLDSLNTHLHEQQALAYANVALHSRKTNGHPHIELSEEHLQSVLHLVKLNLSAHNETRAFCTAYSRPPTRSERTYEEFERDLKLSLRDRDGSGEHMDVCVYLQGASGVVDPMRLITGPRAKLFDVNGESIGGAYNVYVTANLSADYIDWIFMGTWHLQGWPQTEEEAHLANLGTGDENPEQPTVS